MCRLSDFEHVLDVWVWFFAWLWRVLVKIYIEDLQSFIAFRISLDLFWFFDRNAQNRNFFFKWASIHGPNLVPQKFRHVWDIIRTSTEKFRRFCTRDSLTTDILSVNSRGNEENNPGFPLELQNAALPWLGMGTGRSSPSREQKFQSVWP